GTGLTRPAAARFSFLLGTPIIAGAGIQQLINLGREGGSAGAPAASLAVGFIVAAVTGYLCIRFLLAYLQRGTLYVFAVYCWVMGLSVVVLWQVTGGRGLV
ncbi:MAG: undecaprenyl-diphosphate phosphatase, partial [Chloroflexota bacterium]